VNKIFGESIAFEEKKERKRKKEAGMSIKLLIKAPVNPRDKYSQSHRFLGFLHSLTQAAVVSGEPRSNALNFRLLGFLAPQRH